MSRAGASEDVIVAGILHDVVEDSEAELSEVRERFGDAVAQLVDAVTEHDKSLPWAERKRIALVHIEEMSQDALLLKSADVLHNVSELVHDVEEHGEAVFEKFNAPKEQKLTQQRKLVQALEAAWPENPLLPEVRDGARKLLRVSSPEVMNG